MISVGLVQINNSFSQANYLPLSVGVLQAYAQAHCHQAEQLRFLPAIFARMPVEKAVQQLLTADVVGFSAYVWNIQISLAIAAELKRRNPRVLVVFGGPQVPDHPAEFMKQNRFIDLCVHGEGEVIFTQLLDVFEAGQWSVQTLSSLASVSYWKDDELVHRPRASRLKDLNVIPSPFLSGVFDPLMQAHPDQQWLALWETNRGCPFSCTFCDWGSATQAKVYQFDLDRLRREVDWFASRKIEFVFCCDANFGILPRDLDIAKYVSEVKQAQGYPQALSVQNTKNATERAYQVQKTLSDQGLNKGVTLSMQSMDPHTLKTIRRDNISLDSYQELQRRFTRDRVETYSDMILGLPGETFDSFVDGVAALIANGQHNRIQFNNLAILPNAEMGDPAYQERYGIRTVETKIVNIHGSLAPSEDGIYEKQDLVISTHSMPEAEWRRTRSFCWMTALLHFDKVLQIPILLIHQLTGADYKKLLLRFANLEEARYPVLSGLVQFFRQTAREIQQGAPEYVQSEKWLNIYWPTDEFALIQMVFEGQLSDFYREAQSLLQEFLDEEGLELPSGLLEQSVRLNQALLKLPQVRDDLEVELTYNLWEIYQAALVGEDQPLRTGSWRHSIDRHSKQWPDWDSWCREVVWYGNKKGAYLYTNNVLEGQLEGHY